MKIVQIYLCTIILFTTVNLLATSSRTKEVSVSELRATPEEYSNKRITISTYYSNFIPNFPGWLVRHGFNSEKYFYLKANPMSVPFLVKKKSDVGKSLMDIKVKSKVTISGKIRKFKKLSIKDRRRYSAKFPQYYLEVENIEVVETPKKKKQKQEQETEIKTKPKTHMINTSSGKSFLPPTRL